MIKTEETKAEESTIATNDQVVEEQSQPEGEKGDNTDEKTDNDTPLHVGNEGDEKNDIKEETEQKSESWHFMMMIIVSYYHLFHVWNYTAFIKNVQSLEPYTQMQ